MSVSILDALRNAQHNFRDNFSTARIIAAEQLYNAINLLEKGYATHDLIEPLLQEYGNISAVPPKPPEHPRCGCCGSKRIAIRGRHPNEPKRVICPTCTAERLDDIHKQSDPSYGIACAAEPVST